MKTLGVLIALMLILTAAAPATAAVKVTPYGFMLVNAKYNSAVQADIPVIAVPSGADTSSFLITPRQTRLGLNLRGDGLWEPKGKLELDFWGLKGSGANGAALQTAPRLRLAYFTVNPGPQIELTFGQNWSVFAPRNPVSLGHTSVPAFTGSGNLWNRFPQVTLTWNPDTDCCGDGLFVMLSMVRPLAADIAPLATEAIAPGDSALVYRLYGQGDVMGAGEKNGMPFFEGSIGLGIVEGFDAGVSFHYGQGDYGGTTLDTWAVALDAGFKSGPTEIQGEFFTGQNLRMLFSNAHIFTNAQGRLEEREAMGGWGQLGYAPVDEWGMYIGAGYEDVDSVLTNLTVLASVMYRPLEGIVFALEYGRIDTQWEDTPAIQGVNDEIGLGFQWKF